MLSCSRMARSGPRRRPGWIDRSASLETLSRGGCARYKWEQIGLGGTDFADEMQKGHLEITLYVLCQLIRIAGIVVAKRDGDTSHHSPRIYAAWTPPRPIDIYSPICSPFHNLSRTIWRIKETTRPCLVAAISPPRESASGGRSCSTSNEKLFLKAKPKG